MPKDQVPLLADARPQSIGASIQVRIAKAIEGLVLALVVVDQVQGHAASKAPSNAQRQHM